MVKRNKSRVIVDSEDEDYVSEEPKRPKVQEDPEEGEVEEEVEKSSSEDEEEVEEEDEEEEEESDDGSNADDEWDDDDGKFPDGLDADLMGDEEDRARLQAMSEKEREQELFERLEKREALKTRLKIERQLKRDKKKKKGGKNDKSSRSSPKSAAAPPPAEDDSPPASPGFEEEYEDEDESSAVKPVRKFESKEKSMKMNAIQRLKDERERKKQNAEAQRQQREQKQKEAQKRRKELVEDQDGSSNDAPMKREKSKQVLKPSDIYSSDDDDDANNEDDKDEDYKLKPRTKSDSSSVSSNVDSSSSSSSDDSDKGDKDDSDGEDIKVSAKPIAQKDDLVRIRVSRHKLARWCHAPFFHDAVVGAFVRVNLGTAPNGIPTYRIAEIEGVVKTAKVYSTEGITTDKGLKLKYCDSVRMYRIEFISNQPISDTEFTKWYSDMVARKQNLPLMDDVLKKQRQLLNLANYSYTDQDVDAIVREKERFRANPRNYAMKKTDLLKEKLEAESEGNMERLRMVNDKINEIEERAEMLDKQRTQNISAVTYINNRNKMHNLKEAEKAVAKEYRAMMSKEGSDPFTRRKSRPTLVTKARDGKVDETLLKELRQKSVQHLQPKPADGTPSKTPGLDSTDSTQKAALAEKENNSNGTSSTLNVTLNGSAMSLLDDSISGSTPNKSKKDDLFSVHNFDIDIDVSTPTVSSLNSSSSSSDWSSGFGLGDMGAPCVPRRSLNLEQYKREKGLI